MIYVILAIFVIASIVCFVKARNDISNSSSNKEQDEKRAKWKMIGGLLGAAVVIVFGIYIFTTFMP